MKLSLRQLRYLWISMFLLQELWLAATWLAGASANPRKLIVVAVYSLVCLFIVLLLSDKVVARLRSGYGWLDEHHTDFLVLLGLVLFAIGMIYIQGQRVWTDEAENFKFSSGWSKFGLSYYWHNYADYGWVRQHPPLIFLLNGLSMLIFGVDLRVLRWATAFFSLGALAATYLLGRTLYNRSVGILAAVYLVTFPLFVRVGTAGMLDTQTLFFFTVAVLLTVMIVRKPSGWLGAALGLTLGLGMLTKYLMMMAIPLIMILVIAALARLDKSAPDRWKKAAGLLRPFMIAALISGAMYLSWAWYADQIGVRTPLAGTFQLFRPAQQEAEALPRDDAGDQDEYMSFSLGFFLFSAEGLKFSLNVLLTRLPPAIGFYNFPLIALGGWLLYKRRSRADILLLAWIAIVAGLLFLTIPDHRYFMPIFPALTMMIACWLDRNPEAIERTTMLAFLFQLGALYIFIDWNRLSLLF